MPFLEVPRLVAIFCNGGIVASCGASKSMKTFDQLCVGIVSLKLGFSLSGVRLENYVPCLSENVRKCSGTMLISCPSITVQTSPGS